MLYCPSLSQQQHWQLLSLCQSAVEWLVCINVIFLHLFLNKSIPEYYLHDGRDHALR